MDYKSRFDDDDSETQTLKLLGCRLDAVAKPKRFVQLFHQIRAASLACLRCELGHRWRGRFGPECDNYQAQPLRQPFLAFAVDAVVGVGQRGHCNMNYRLWHIYVTSQPDSNTDHSNIWE